MIAIEERRNIVLSAFSHPISLPQPCMQKTLLEQVVANIETGWNAYGGRDVRETER